MTTDVLERTTATGLSGQTSADGPALAVCQGYLCLAWSGTGQNHLNVWPSSDGVTFKPDNHTVIDDQTSTYSPALISSPSQDLTIVWTGGGGKINAMFCQDPNLKGPLNFAHQSVNGVFTSQHGPAAVVTTPGQECLAFTGVDPKINIYNTVSFGIHVVLPPPFVSAFAPALAVFAGRTYLAWADAKTKLVQLASSSDGLNFKAVGQVSDIAAINAPAMATFGGLLYIAWPMGNSPKSNVQINSYDGTSFKSGVLSSTAFTKKPPALASYTNPSTGVTGLYLAWTDKDAGLNLETLKQSNPAT